MALLTINTLDRDANAYTYEGANAGGDEWLNTGKQLLLVNHTNAGGTNVVLTFSFELIVDGQTVPDRTVTIVKGTSQVLGLWPKNWYNDGDEHVNVDTDAEVDIEYAVITCP